MNKAFLIIVFLLVLITASAQQDPESSQYMQNNLMVNPGYAGSRDAICASGMLRKPFAGITGTPNIGQFSVDASVKPFKINSGIGLTFITDKLGFESNTGFKFSYAYRMNVNNGNGKLGIGVSAGIYQQGIEGVWNPPKEGTDASQDYGIPGAKEKATPFDLGFGLFYKSENAYFGLSSTHINKPTFSYEKSKPILIPHYYLTTGYNIALPNPSFDLQPSVFIGTGGLITRVDLTAVVVYNKRFWGGISYRVQVAIVGMLGFELANGMKVGCSYDFATSSSRSYSRGSYEISIGYCFSIIREKIPHKYKSIRFL